jgi:hypothetical protein
MNTFATLSSEKSPFNMLWTTIITAALTSALATAITYNLIRRAEARRSIKLLDDYFAKDWEDTDL